MRRDFEQYDIYMGKEERYCTSCGCSSANNHIYIIDGYICYDCLRDDYESYHTIEFECGWLNYDNLR